jgi:hypothetical protein
VGIFDHVVAYVIIDGTPGKIRKNLKKFRKLLEKFTDA